MHTDLQLLSRYNKRGDAVAFRDLMQTHAGMVFTTAKRITRDEALSEDVAQETFLQLARHSKNITESVAAWLHRVAWRRACNMVRGESRRRRYENDAASAAEAAAAPSGEATWAEVETVLDSVIDELPDELRAPLVMHFLQGRTQRDIAKELSMSQSTVSRAIESGLVEMRSRLGKKGMLCGVGLGAMLAAHSVSAAAVPATLLTSLTKLGMSGIGGGSMGASSLALMSLSMKIGLALAVVTTAAVVGVANTAHRDQVPPSQPAAVPAVAEEPRTAQKVDWSALVGKVTGGLAQVGLQASAQPTAVATPVHELVHSFPLPPRRPSGHIVQDAEGWIWGTNGSGGNYGLGTIYKMRPDGSEWQEVVSFNGITGVPRGSYPRGGVMQTPDGALWGTTSIGGANNQGTLFRYDPKTDELETMAEFDGLGQPRATPTLAPDGQLWGTTHYTVYRFNPTDRQLVIVFRGTGKGGAHPGTQFEGELVADGQGNFWGASEAGGAANLGVIFKVNIATGEQKTVVEFTGRGGAVRGSTPVAALTLDPDGFLWGTTRSGGSADRGTVYKVHAATGTLTTVAEFRPRAHDDPGAHPETQLIADGMGNFWGTTTSDGGGQHGTVFKVDARTGVFSSVVTFTGLEGALRGGPARGHLFNDGAGGFIGACDGGGAVGTIFRVDIKTGAYKELTNVCDLAKTKEGHDVHGTLVAGSGDWLWGLADGGAHHYGVIYKFNTVTNELVNVVDFTGTKGPYKGRYMEAGLVSDGQGWFWGTTIQGGASDIGTIFKIQESTGNFITVAEAKHPTGGALAREPASQLVPDGKGFLWGTTLWTVYKVNISTSVVTTVATFYGDSKPPYGSGGLGRIAIDNKGILWGCSQADAHHKRGCLYKIDTSNDAFTTLTEFTSTRRNPSYWNRGGDAFWHSKADMCWDGRGYMWFTAVIDEGTKRTPCSLFKLNTSTGAIEGRFSPRGLDMLGVPTMDENGVLWGGTLEEGYMDNGSVYTFDTRTQKFATVVAFTGHGSQARTGQQPQGSGLMKHRDGNFYGITRVGGPGNGGTVFRLRLGPTPMTQEAVLLADGSVALHGQITPNGLDTQAAFEWGTDPELKQSTTLDAGLVTAGQAAKAVTTTLTKLHPATTYYFRITGSNAANAIAQRGAVLRFTTPATGAGLADPTLAEAGTDGGSSTSGAADASQSKYSLTVNRIPGAGAGFVKGALKGTAYEVGKRYSITALADNGYVFDHWTGPGISGANAESRTLSFVFTQELAKSPVITATFVRNPFGESTTGSFNGLALAADGVVPDLSNTGALRVTITHTGTFTGTLRYDGDIIPVAGAFDNGGLARFGANRASPWTPTREGKPTLLITMQIDLSADGTHQLLATIEGVADSTATERSVIVASRSYYDGRKRLVPAPFLAADGNTPLSISGSANDEGSGKMHVSPGGSATFVAKLSDGTAVLAEAPLSQANQAAFFMQLYAKRSGSFGGLMTLDTISQNQPFWWTRPEPAWLDLSVHRLAP